MPGTRMGYLTRVIRHGRTAGERKPAPIVHGTRHAYERRGCRCCQCCAANRAATREYRRRPKTWPAWAHGRAPTYASGCRCALCRGANAAAKRAARTCAGRN